MDYLNKGSNYLNKSVSVISDNNILGPVVAILLILFTVLMVPKLPTSFTSIVHNTYFRILFIIIIILLAKKHLVLSLMCLIIFFIINSMPTKKNKQAVQSTTQPVVQSTTQPVVQSTTQPVVQSTTQPVVQSTTQSVVQSTTQSVVQLTTQPIVQSTTKLDVQSTTQPVVQSTTKLVQYTTQSDVQSITQPDTEYRTFPTLNPTKSGVVIAYIPIAVASAYALHDSMRSNVINGSAIPINKNITPITASTILAVTSMANNIVSNIIENFTDYVNNTIRNEEIMRNDAVSNLNSKLSQELENSANKLAISRNAVTSIVNNNNVDANNHLIKSLVKSDLLKEASNKALETGDNITAQQLQQVSLSQSNIVNALVQSDVLKNAAKNAQNNGLIKESSIISEIANTHLLASLNMINYNNHMESALDEFNRGNYESSKTHENQANEYLKNNITLNDKIKGLPVKSSELLYEEIQKPKIPFPNKCDNIPAVDISGWDDYNHANF